MAADKLKAGTGRRVNAAAGIADQLGADPTGDISDVPDYLPARANQVFMLHFCAPETGL